MTAPAENMKGKICLVTGGTDGIGKAVVEGLARRGARVIFTGRDKSKGNALADQLEREGWHKPDFWACDFADFRQVRALAEFIKNSYRKIDVLINNAGAFFTERRLNPDGIELQFAVNHLSGFLLTVSLLEWVKAAPAGRIIVTSSTGHYGGKIDFEDLNFDDRPYNGLTAYKQSKMANVLFANELARRLKHFNIPVNSLHPGVVKTSIAQKESKGFYRILWGMAKPFMISLEKGAATTLYLACNPEAANHTGEYFVKSKPVKPDKAALDETLAKRLWDLSEKLTLLK